MAHLEPSARATVPSTASGFDAIVVGAGVMGLAIAEVLLRENRRVLILERERSSTDLAEGTSMRAYGNVLALGHPRGLRTEWALRARELWLDRLTRARAWYRADGIVLLGRALEEQRLLEELQAEHINPALETALLTPGEIERHLPSLAGRPARTALYSPKDILVDPRTLFPAWRASIAASPGATYLAGCPALAVESGEVHTPRGRFDAERIYLCTGSDVAGLFGDLPLIEVKLQMLACRPLAESLRWKQVVAGGLTMAHMKCFAGCRGLSDLQAYLAERYPAHVTHGIHVMGAVARDGSVLIGDSHEYGPDIHFTDKQEIDDLMRVYLQDLVGLGTLEPWYRWQAKYYRNGDHPWWIDEPRKGVTAVLALGGTGVTYSLALAEHVVHNGAIDPLAQRSPLT